MRGEIAEDYAVIAARADLVRRGFGTRRGDKIYLHPVEAVYLQLNSGYQFAELPELFRWARKAARNFEAMYFVYEDLRNRGIRARIGGEYVLGKRAYLPVAEKDEIDLADVAKRSTKFEDFAVAIVDEESEVTYYRAYVFEPSGEQIEDLPEFEGWLVGDRVVVENKEVFRRYFYGSEGRNFVTLSLIESVYLAEIGCLKLKNASFEELFEAARATENFGRRYEVYRDLKKRRLVVKTGFKFGSDFRAYRRVESVDDLPHSEYLITIADDTVLKPSELARAVRLAQSVRKKMVFVVHDKYLCVERVRV